MDISNIVSAGALGYIVGLFSVGLIGLLVGVRLGAGATVSTPPSEDEQLVAALRVLRRHHEQSALAKMQAAGAELWSPDPGRVAELSYGAPVDAADEMRP